MPATDKNFLGQIALRLGFITKGQLEECLNIQKRYPQNLGQIFCEKKYLTPQQLATVLKEQKKIQQNPSYQISSQSKANEDLMPEVEIIDEVDLEESSAELITNIMDNPFLDNQSDIKEDIIAIERQGQVDITLAEELEETGQEEIVHEHKQSQVDITLAEELEETGQEEIVHEHKQSQVDITLAEELEETGQEEHEDNYEEQDEIPSIFSSEPPNEEESISIFDMEPTTQENKPNNEYVPFSLNWTYLGQAPQKSDGFGVSPIGDAIDLEGSSKKTSNKKLGRLDLDMDIGADAQTRAINMDTRKSGSKNNVVDHALDHLEDNFGTNFNQIETEKTEVNQEEFGLDSNFFSSLSNADPVDNIEQEHEEQGRIRTAGPNEATIFHAPQQTAKPVMKVQASFPDIPNFEPGNVIPTELPSKKNNVDKNKRKIDKTGKIDKIETDFSEIISEKKIPSIPRRSRRRKLQNTESSFQNVAFLGILGSVILFGIIVLLTSNFQNKKKPVITTPPPIEKNSVQPVQPEIDFESLYNEAIQHYTNGRIKEALYRFERIKNYKDTRLYRAQYFLNEEQNTEKCKQELELYAQNQNQNQISSLFYLVQARYHEKLLNYDSANENYRKISESDQTNYKIALLGLSRTARAQKKYIESLEYAYRALENGEILAKAEIAANQKLIVTQIYNMDYTNVQSYIDLLKEAIRVDPGFIDYYFLVARLIWKEQPEEALKFLREYLKDMTKISTQHQVEATNLYQCCLYYSRNNEEMEKFAQKLLNGEQPIVSLGSLLALVAVNLHKEKTKTKESEKDYKKNAMVYFSIFNKIYIARSEYEPKSQDAEPWLWDMSRDLQNSLGNMAKVTKDIRYIKRLIQIDVIIIPPRPLGLNTGDVIIKINDQPIFSHYEVFKECNNLQKITIRRQDTIKELEPSEISVPNIRRAVFIHRIQLFND